MAAADQRRLGHEAAGEQHAVAGDSQRSAVGRADEHTPRRAATADLDQLGAVDGRRCRAAAGTAPAHAAPWGGRWPRSSPRAGCRAPPAGEQGREADQLGAHHHRPAERHEARPWIIACSVPVVSTPSGRSPEISRACARRSRARPSPARPAQRPGRRARRGSRRRCAHPAPSATTAWPVRMTTPAAPAWSTQPARHRPGPVSTRPNSRIPNGGWPQWRGTPPAAGSRSSTSTRPTPRRRSAMAAASPAGPPPTIATSWRPGSAMADGQRLGEASRGQRARARRRSRSPGSGPCPPGCGASARRGRGPAAARPAPPRSRAGSPARSGRRSRHGPEPPSPVPDARPDWACAAMTGVGDARRTPEAKKLGRVPGQAQGGGEAGRADAADRQPVALGQVPDAVVLALGRGPQARHRSPSPACRPGPAPSRPRGRSAAPASPAPRSPARDPPAPRRSGPPAGCRTPSGPAPRPWCARSGTGRIVVRSSWAAALSNTTNWPLRGRIAISAPPSRRCSTTSPNRPAQFTTVLARDSPAVVRSVQRPCARSPPSTSASNRTCAPFSTRLPQIGQRRRPGVDDVLAGNQQPAQGRGRQLRLARQQLRTTERAGRRSTPFARA